MSGKNWEVDPETKQKLQGLQKLPGNTTCVDCSSPGPQWASPKFGIFMCLSCSGIHRGLGVHVSFVRSITMDAFKPAELARMTAGGNNAWKTFWENHDAVKLEDLNWDDCTIRERYEGDVGEEYKARLTAKVEGREYVAGEEKVNLPPKKVVEPQSLGGSRSGTPLGRRGGAGGLGGGVGSAGGRTPRSASPALGTVSMGKKAQNEAFFARMGSENAGRPDDLPPSQGGKFTGFGSDPFPTAQRSEGGGIPGADEFQKDPLGALTKGFGWFGGMVQKGVGEGMQRIAAADLQSHAKALGTTVTSTVSSTLQTGGKVATDTLSRFVEGDAVHHSQRTPNAGGPEPEHQDFWDDFAATGEQRMAEKKGPAADKLDFWDDFAAAGEARMAAKKSVEPERKDFWDEFSNSGGAAKEAKQVPAKTKPSSIGTAAMSKRRPAGKDDEWNEW
ncbi:ArfGap-domain-containing protein [Microthyrium microscopicum]|uniref:ArfGap-domain-containing protein n=1 Tax=Microthyrium microscopicum TaxID=703497 RepID=A0A6A6UTM7_9PEZI|nr:ArfGap-domain-containing protein [Microthyrium microscopicum]